MSRPASRMANYILAAGLIVLGIGALFRSRVQAWEATLAPHDMLWIKVLVSAAATAFLISLLILALAGRRAGKPENPEA